MTNSKILVVYYSRSGTTRTIAEVISRALSCNVEEIRVKDDPPGIGGYFRSCFESMRERPADFEMLSCDPSAYDLVIIGTPVWAHSMSTPVRSFLAANKTRLHHVAFFCTHGGWGADGALKKMQTLLGKPPQAICAVTAREVASGRFAAKLAQFVKALVAGEAEAKRAA
ncbi:MAG: flavodoxin [Rhizomicrobium sp.]